MHRSVSMSNDKIELFQLFIQQTLEGDINYKESVNSVINDTHELVTGKKDIYSINRVNFQIILYLSENFPNLFEEIDIHNLNKNLYKKLLDILNSKLELA